MHVSVRRRAFPYCIATGALLAEVWFSGPGERDHIPRIRKPTEFRPEVSMDIVSPNRVGGVLGLLLGGWHLLWSLLVALGVAQPLVNFVFWLHFMSPPLVVQTFHADVALSTRFFYGGAWICPGLHFWHVVELGPGVRTAARFTVSAIRWHLCRPGLRAFRLRVSAGRPRRKNLPKPRTRPPIRSTLE